MQKRLLAKEDLFTIRLAGDPQISPEGDWIVYVLSSVNANENRYESSLFGVKASGGDSFRLTSGPHDSKPRFSPNGKELAFLSKRSGSSQIWILPLQKGEATQFTFVKGGLLDYRWLPDGSGFVYTANLDQKGIEDEKSVEIENDLYLKFTKDVKEIETLFYKADGMGYLGSHRPQLVYHQRETAPIQLTFGPQFIYQLCDVDSSGRRILFTSRQDDDWGRNAWSSYLYEYNMEEARVRYLVCKEFDVQQATYSPKGDRIAMIASVSDVIGSSSKLYMVPMQGGEPEACVPYFDRTFSNIALCDIPISGNTPLIWGWGSKSVYVPVSDSGKVSIYKIFVDTQKIESVVEGDRTIFSYSFSANTRKIAFAATQFDNPADIYVFDTDIVGQRVKEKKLTDVNKEWLSQIKLSEPEHMKARANRKSPEIDMWVMKPTEFDSTKSYPTVLEIHGGPMMMYGHAFFFEFQLTAAEGFGIAFSNPRGSQGYGEDFCTVIAKEWGKKDYDDVMAVRKRALRRHKWIDERLFSVAGGSYGGFMTAWIIGHTEKFKAAICSRPVIHWAAMAGTSDGNWAWLRRFDMVAPWDDDKAYKQQSPYSYISNVVTPVLIEVQEGDLRCPFEQGQMYFAALKYLNKAPVKFVTYPNEFHGMSRNGKPWNKVHRLHQIISWLNQYGK
jgi:dipeptidyl aminopeptidase/acylaminoacyl peptidase